MNAQKGDRLDPALVRAIWERIRRRLDVLDLSKAEASRRATGGQNVDAVRDIERSANGDPKAVSLHMMLKLAPVLETSVAWLLEGKGPEDAKQAETGLVPVVGYVGAGRMGHFYATDGGPVEDPVPDPLHGRYTLEAVRVRGDSMLPDIEDGSLIYYEASRQLPTEEVLARKGAVICGLEDGKILVKRVVRGSQPGTFHLLSTNEEPLFDQRLAWACLIRFIEFPQ
jgi:phage repressor protein C with HTH and peptisase S24 domain